MVQIILTKFYKNGNMPTGTYYLIRVGQLERWMHEREFVRLVKGV